LVITSATGRREDAGPAVEKVGVAAGDTRSSRPLGVSRRRRGPRGAPEEIEEIERQPLGRQGRADRCLAVGVGVLDNKPRNVECPVHPDVRVDAVAKLLADRDARVLGADEEPGVGPGVVPAVAVVAGREVEKVGALLGGVARSRLVGVRCRAVDMVGLEGHRDTSSSAATSARLPAIVPSTRHSVSTPVSVAQETVR
jgi:hypothetical protein